MAGSPLSDFYNRMLREEPMFEFFAAIFDASKFAAARRLASSSLGWPRSSASHRKRRGDNPAGRSRGKAAQTVFKPAFIAVAANKPLDLIGLNGMLS